MNSAGNIDVSIALAHSCMKYTYVFLLATLHLLKFKIVAQAALERYTRILLKKIVVWDF